MDIDLSYSMQHKHSRIIEYKNELKNIKNKLSKKHIWIYLFVFLILFIISVNEISPYLEEYFSFSNQTTSLSLKSIIILILFAISVILLFLEYFSLKKLSEKLELTNNKYEKLRINIIDNIEHDFCKCNTWCNCKENYIRKMKDQYNIDLIF